MDGLSRIWEGQIIRTRCEKQGRKEERKKKKTVTKKESAEKKDFIE